MDEENYIKEASRFLNGGKDSNLSEDDLITSCNRLISKLSGRSIKSGLALAEKFHKRSRGRGKIIEAAAAKTLARLTHMSGDHKGALPFYLNALDLSRSNPLERAKIKRALIDVYMYLGEFSKAREAARDARTIFKKSGAESDLIMTEINYANLLHRQDRHEEAEKLYRKGAEFFAKKDNKPAAARCNYNRANTLVQLFYFDEAEKLYQDVKRVYLDNEQLLDANDASYGLAWLNMLSGKFHIAIKDLSECRRIYHEGGDPKGEALCILDLAEVYLGLNLYPDALDCAKKSRRLFSRLKMRYEFAKASLFLGQAADALGLSKVAQKACVDAEAGFKAENNVGFTGVTHLLAADLSKDDAKSRKDRLRSARSCFKRSQLPHWEAISDLRQAVDPKQTDSALARIEKNRAAQMVPHIFASWQIARGDKYAKGGKTRAARLCWKKAADRLDSVRAQLPPIELRNAYGQNQNSPHRRLIVSELKDNPLKASAWLERYKTAGIWSPLHGVEINTDKRKEAEESLRLLADQVAMISRQVYDSASQRNISPRAVQKRISNIQRQIRESIASIEETSVAAIDSVDYLEDHIKKISHQIPIIQFHQRGDDLIAFVHKGGEISTVPYDDGTAKLKKVLRRWRFILEGELLAEQTGEAWDFEPELMLWEELGQWLWQPLNIGKDVPKVLIVPEGETANLPWPALRPEGLPLGDYTNFIITPSIRHFIAARKREVNSDIIEVFRGSSDGLKNIDRELDIFRKAGNPIIHNPSLRENWPSSGDAAIWHFAGHSALRIDNPFYSYLYLNDGPLFAADFRLKQCQVKIVSLAACSSGEEVTLPGEESIGLIRSLLEMGARNVVASRWPVSDKSTSLWMREFYCQIFENISILESAQKASESVRKAFPSAYHWAAFAVFGAGDMGGNYDN